MALTTGELWRLKYELGFNVLNEGAEPYANVVSYFELVVLPSLNAQADTTSSTTVTATSDGEPAPVTLALASGTGISVHDTLVVDVDVRQELPTVQYVSGNDVTVMLAKAHSGTYPVSVEGGITIVRGLLRRLRDISRRLGEDGVDSAGIKRVDEITFKDGAEQSAWIELKNDQMNLRDELASALGIENVWRKKQAGSSLMELY